MRRQLTKQEEALVELIHFLSFGDEGHLGLSFEEIKSFLITPIQSKDGKNALECLALEGSQFTQDLQDYLAEEEVQAED